MGKFVVIVELSVSITKGTGCGRALNVCFANYGVMLSC